MPSVVVANAERNRVQVKAALRSMDGVMGLNGTEASPVVIFLRDEARELPDLLQVGRVAPVA
jgi:hypothetical protein